MTGELQYSCYFSRYFPNSIWDLRVSLMYDSEWYDMISFQSTILIWDTKSDLVFVLHQPGLEFTIAPSPLWCMNRGIRYWWTGYHCYILKPPVIVDRVLTVHGSADEVIPVEDALEFAKLIPNHKLHIVEGANHNYSAHQEELASVVLDFLKSNKVSSCTSETRILFARF